MIRDFLKSCFVFAFLWSLFFVAVSPQSVIAVPPNTVKSPEVKAICSTDGKITLILTKTDPNHKHYQIKITAQTEPDNSPKKVVADEQNFTRSLFSTTVTSGRYYWYYVRTVAKDGQVSNPQGGAGSILYCELAAPRSLTSSYSSPYVTLSWKPVNGAVKYAIRVDNTKSPWNGPDGDYIPTFDQDTQDLLSAFPLEEGDHVHNSLNETQFRFKASGNRKIGKIVWWVYAIGEDKVFSSKTRETSYIRE